MVGLVGVCGMVCGVWGVKAWNTSVVKNLYYIKNIKIKIFFLSIHMHTT